MHIQEGTNTTLTTCTKMTEEVDRRHGVNGNSSKGANEDAAVHNSALAGTGGRLKFFKDGKFILELVRGAGREGGRWVSVPRKTFWPPAPPAPAAPPPASLSASDDNSSVHSSPWQRDHCWKQPQPRRNLSKELALYYCRPAGLPCAAIAAAARRRRRRPLAPPPDAPPALRNGAERAASPAADDREKHYHMKLKKPHQYHKLRVYKKTRSPFRPKLLNRTIERLRERVAALPAPVNAKLASCRQEHAMVSPRKRILRELERVSLEDAGGKRRARTAPLGAYPLSPGYPPSPGPSQPKAEPRPQNGAARRDAVSKNVSSYSIHSLLSMPDDSRRSPRSPQCPPPAKTESPVSVASPEARASPDGYRYRYPALALGSPGPSPPPAPYRYGYRRDEWPLYPYPYPLYRPPLWMHYAVAPAAPPGPWAPLPHPHPLLTDHIPKEEPTSDLPLNLSKH